MRLGDLVAGMDVRLRGEAGLTSVLPGDVAMTRVCDITEDSRTVLPGSMFVARGGLKADGKAFVASAIEAGAVVVLTDDSELLVAGSAQVPVLVAKDVQLVSALIAVVHCRL